MLPWTLFATSLSDASSSLINSANLISKVYFPRMIVPTATVVVALVDFLISFCILAVCSFGINSYPAGRLCSCRCFCCSVASRASARLSGSPRLMSNTAIFRFVIPFLVQFASMSRRSASAPASCPRSGACSIRLNPMVAVIDGFRWCLLGGEIQLYWPGLLLGRRHHRLLSSGLASPGSGKWNGVSLT